MRKSKFCHTPTMRCDSDVGTRRVLIGDLPILVMTEIFSYLNPRDLARASQVCSYWNELAYQPALWTKIAPIQWIKEFWEPDQNTVSKDHYPHSTPEEEETQEEATAQDDDTKIELTLKTFSITRKLGLVKVTKDETVEEVKPKFKFLYRRCIREFRIFSGLILYVLNRVGLGVKVIDVSRSVTFNDTVLNLLLTFCPNVEVLNAKYTSVGKDAFHNIHEVGSCRKLKAITLKGCGSLQDRALRSLAKCWEDSPTEITNPPERQHIMLSVICMTEKQLYDLIVDEYECIFVTERKNSKKNIISTQVPVLFMVNRTKGKVSGLKSINVSGCYNLTDDGLKEMMKTRTALTNLEHVDFSGCHRFTGRTLQHFVSCSNGLPPENVFYCDHILGGPYNSTANGCLNLQCPQRACCVPLE